jgi:hypothetical protein
MAANFATRTTWTQPLRWSHHRRWKLSVEKLCSLQRACGRGIKREKKSWYQYVFFLQRQRHRDQSEEKGYPEAVPR